MQQYIRQKLNSNHTHFFWIPTFLFLLLGLQYYQPNMGGTGTDLPINLVGWLFISLSVSIGLWQLYLRGYLKFNNQILIIGGCLFVLYIPFLYGKSTPQLSTWFRFLAIPLIYLFLLVSLQFRVTQKTKLVGVVAIFLSVSVHLLISIYQHTSTNHPFPPFGHFQQKNLMGSYLTTGYACLFFLVNTLDFGSKKQRLAFIVILALISFGIGFINYELNSRGAQISALLVTAFSVLYYLKQRQRNHTFVIIIASFLFSFIAQHFNASNTQSNSNLAPSLSQFQQDYDREILYPQTLDLISKNIITGVGYGNFEAAYTQYSASVAEQQNDPNLVRHNMSHPHNEGLYWFAEGGIVAGLSVTILLLLLLVWLIKRNDSKFWLILALFTPIGVHTLTEYPLHASVAHLVVLLLLTRLFILKNSSRKIQIPTNLALLFRPLSLIMTLLVSAFCLTGLHTISLVLDYEKAGGTSPEAYLHIINPLVHHDRYWSNIMAHKARIAINEGNTEGVKEYIRWAEKEVEHHPKQQYFENMIRLKNFLGELTKEDCKRYEFYFPKQECAKLTHSAKKAN